MEQVIAELDQQLKGYIDQRKQLEGQVAKSKKALEFLRKQKGRKATLTVRNKLEEDVLVPHGVVPASYHGGDFNGVSCRAFMGNSEEIFITGGEKSSDSLQSCLLAVDPTKRCPDSEILKMTKIYSVLFRLMDGFFSIMRCPFGKATPEDTESLQTLLQKMIPIWKKLDLPETPKWHATVEHAINQFHRLKGYGEAQEDFIEFFHQEGNNELNRFRCIKDYKKKRSAY